MPAFLNIDIMLLVYSGAYCDLCVRGLVKSPEFSAYLAQNVILVSASRGLCFASQFCYIIAQVPFGCYHKKTSKIVLLGAAHR